MNAEGSCLCGKVQLKIEDIEENITVCHCQMCQKFHGGAMIALSPCRREQVAFEEQMLQWYESSAWAQRGFCSQCGSSICYFEKETEKFYFSAGLFPHLSEAIVTEEMFTKDQPPYLHIAEKTIRWPGLPGKS
jgi:hypothetical protein